jgi:glycine/serine hydroxymethyltransferase
MFQVGSHYISRTIGGFYVHAIAAGIVTIESEETGEFSQHTATILSASLA